MGTGWLTHPPSDPVSTIRRSYACIPKEGATRESEPPQNNSATDRNRTTMPFLAVSTEPIMQFFKHGKQSKRLVI